MYRRDDNSSGSHNVQKELIFLTRGKRFAKEYVLSCYGGAFYIIEACKE